MSRPPVQTSASNLQHHQVAVGGDNKFQQRARLLQSLWRADHGWAPGLHHGTPLGSLLAAPDAGANFLTPAVRALVDADLTLNAHRPVADRKLLQLPRLRNNLLSSQPMCFNLFGGLAFDRKLAAAVLTTLFPGRVQRVLDVRFEWSPGRMDLHYLGNKSAADVFVETVTPAGDRSFIAFETKYHEAMTGSAGAWKPRYDEVLAKDPIVDLDDELHGGRLQQVLFDHLLTAALNQADDGYRDGLFVLLYPAPNTDVAHVAEQYRTRLTEHGHGSFEAITLESFVDKLQSVSSAGWIDAFRRRYLDWDRVPVAA